MSQRCDTAFGSSSIQGCFEVGQNEVLLWLVFERPGQPEAVFKQIDSKTAPRLNSSREEERTDGDRQDNNPSTAAALGLGPAPRDR